MTDGANGQDEATYAQRIVRRMSELGFTPHPTMSGRVEFRKTYALDEDCLAQAIVYFDRPVFGMAGVRLSGMTVTVQRTLAPTPEAAALAPDPVRDDLLAVTASFDASWPAQSVAARECCRCGELVSDYYIVNDDAVCHECVAERVAERGSGAGP